MNKILALLALSLLLAGCGSDPTAEGCQNDGECQLGFKCVEGACLCQTDDSCDVGQYCNPFGTCQVRPACLGNADCDAGFICNSSDPTGGKCIPADTCGSSAHCRIGEYCSPQTQRCEPGCRRTGDCQLGFVCVAGNCQAGGTAGDCTVCPADPDPDPTYCDYGEQCTFDGSCVSHPRQSNLCDSCGDTNQCADGLICLIDEEVTDASYCAPTCQREADCPSGYEGCGGLFLVTEECTGGQSCSNGGRCITGSESNRGFCECLGQTDCNFYSGLCAGFCLTDFVTSCSEDLDCACSGGRCLGTDFPCSTGADCTIECTQVPSGSDSYGICRTQAQACGKDSGVTCTELTNGTPACQGI